MVSNWWKRHCVKLFTTERAFTTSHVASISFMAYKHFTNEMLHGIWMQWKYLLGHFKDRWILGRNIRSHVVTVDKQMLICWVGTNYCSFHARISLSANRNQGLTLQVSHAAQEVGLPPPLFLKALCAELFTF